MSDELTNPRRILLCRTDRLGDVALTTPCIEATRETFPEAHIGFLVSEYAKPLIENHPMLDEVIPYDEKKDHKGTFGWNRLVKTLKKGKWDSSVIFYSDMSVASALWMAGINKRVGPFTKLYAPLFFNHPIRQKRSKVEIHEAEYNLALLAPIGVAYNPLKKRIATKIVASPESIKKGREIIDLKLKGITYQSSEQSQVEKPMFVHPGMGGSALNWPLERWSEAIKKLNQRNHLVFLTAFGDKEIADANKILGLAGLSEEQVPIISNLNLRDFMGLIANASSVLAPSTGPLHIAVGLGIPVVSIFPPIRVQSVRRWGPYLPREVVKDNIMVPDVHCGRIFTCKGPSCIYYECMPKISAGEVVYRLEKQLGANE